MKKIVQNKRLVNNAINILIIIVLIAAVVPFFITIKYALFVTDDFPLANAVVRNYDGSYFRTGLKCAANYWHVWNGNWFSFFIAYWLHPIVHGGQKTLVVALRIHYLLAIVGALFFCYSLADFFELKIEKSLRIAALTLLPVLLFKEYFDFYLWWLTSCTYLMPLYCFLFGYGIFFFALKNQKVWEYVVSGILLFMMSGGSLNVVGMGCYVLLFTLVAWCTNKKRVCVPAVVIFITTLIGACLNAFAPGSFSRQNAQSTEKVGILKALFIELQIMGVEGKWLILHTAFITFALLAFVWGCKLKKKISLRNLIVATIGSFMLPVVTMFPVIFGYGNIDYKDISNRGYGMMDITIVFATCFMAVLWGVYLSGFLKHQLNKMALLLMILIVLMNVIFCDISITNFVPVQITTNLANGYNKVFFDAWMNIFSFIENSDESDIVIERRVPPRKAGCSWSKLSEDTGQWWNETISTYYGINSLSLINTYK